MAEDKTLENFMKEFFPFQRFKEIGFFTKEMRGDYEAQAEKVRVFFGFETVYEYGKDEIRCHISTGKIGMSVNEDGDLKIKPFVTVFPNIYDTDKLEY